MFMWRAGAFLAEAERHAPELAAFVREFPAGDYSSYLAGRFPLLPRISLDYAIMEKAGRVATLLAEFDWDDVGTWAALPRHLQADGDGNAVLGAVAAVDSSNNIAVGNGRLIALCGVKDVDRGRDARRRPGLPPVGRRKPEKAPAFAAQDGALGHGDAVELHSENDPGGRDPQCDSRFVFRRRAMAGS